MNHTPANLNLAESNLCRSVVTKALATTVLAFIVGTAGAQHCYIAHDEFTHRISVHGVVHAVQWTEERLSISIECNSEHGGHLHELVNTAPAAMLRVLRGGKGSLEVGTELIVEYVPFDSATRNGILTRVLSRDELSSTHASILSAEAPMQPVSR